MNEKAKQCKKDLKLPHHRSFLLRLWYTDGPGGSDWRASLENPETGERIGFARLEELFAYLMDLVERNSKRQETGGKARNENRRLDTY
jgi:hypothetical protein